MNLNIRRRTLWLVLAAVAAIAAGSAYAAPGSNGSVGNANRTINLHEASETPALSFVDIGAPGPSVGDHVVTTDGVVRPNGTAAGTMVQVCTIVKAGPSVFASTYDCSGSFDLEGGSITVAGPFVPTAAENPFAVTGGTGEFKGARGDGVIRAEDDEIMIKL